MSALPDPLRELLEETEAEQQPVPALLSSRRLFKEVSNWQAQMVAAALESGATWEEIGAALGTTRQAAWARFRSVAEKLEGHSVPTSQEVKAMNQRVKDELRGLQSRLKEFDEMWRERQAALTEQARKLEHDRRLERKQLQQEMRSIHASLRDEIHSLRQTPH
jgi:hypothetical protein